MEWQPDERKLKSYVWYEGKCYFVSTIMRDSSAVGYPSRYAETLAWEYDWKTQERGEIVLQDGGGCPLIGHLKAVERLYRNGPKQEDDD